MSQAPANNAVPPIVLFDGLCGFCDASVQRLIRMDRRGVLRFAALQSEAGRALLARHGLPEDLDSMVLVDRGRAMVRSRAVLGALRHAGWPWRAVGWLRVLPPFVLDPAYRFVARGIGTRLPFVGGQGPREACRIPGPGERARFLDSAAELEGLERGRGVGGHDGTGR